MADRVFLHVGAPKSGTSYLQQVLWTNRARLAEDGFVLPGHRGAHYQAMGDLRGGVWGELSRDWTWDRLAQEARDTSGTVVISEEMLGAATAEQAESAIARLEPAEVHVVVAVRDLWRSIPSAWQQSVRARAVGGYGAFVERLRTGGNPGFWANQLPVPVLQRWTATVPAERRHVVTVPRAGAPRAELWRRFASVLGLDPERYDVGTPAGNPSLGGPEAELLRRLNATLGEEFPLSRPYLGVVRAHLTLPVLTAKPSPERLTAPAAEWDWVTERSRQVVAELAAFPCHVVGDLDDLLPTPSTGGPGRSPDDIGTEELLDLALETMVGMLRHTDARVRSLRERLVTEREKVARLSEEVTTLRRSRLATVPARVRSRLRTGRSQGGPA